MRTLRRTLARLSALFTRRRDERRLREEFEHHIAMAAEDNQRSGLSETEAHRQARLLFGPDEPIKEAYRDQRTLRWLEFLLADAIFGWRQLNKHRTASAIAILSLGLATGACISAFRLIDALLWRPLPVAAPEQLYSLSRAGIGFDGKANEFDGWAYPSFQRMREAVKGEAELLAVSYAERTDLTYQSDQEMEKAGVQYVSGWMFSSFGLRPAAGRLLTEDDDRKPGAHPVAVLSYDYWSRRFASDPNAIGRVFHLGAGVFEIVGVGPREFTGTETGVVTDIFLPTMMHSRVTRDDATWHRTIVRIHPGVALEPLRQKLAAVSRAFEMERAKKFTGIRKESIDRYINQALVLQPAASGISGMQQDYRRALGILGVLVVLVLLIACVNAANLMTARAAARAREMALRISIGAGRWRLMQLMLVESTMTACLAVAMGAAFAWWSAPFVIGQINSADNPVRLALPADLRVAGFAGLLTLGVVLLFGLTPALRASTVKPGAALKGGDEPYAQRRTMHFLIAGQVAFCFVILYIAGLFATTFDRLAKRPLGFSSDRLLTLETVAQSPQPVMHWSQAAEQLRATPGVEAVALAQWPLVKGMASNSFISIGGAPPAPSLAFFLSVSPGWLDVMKIPLLAGRDLQPADAGVAMVNETFAREYFDGQNPIGKSFARGRTRYDVIGLVKDAPYRSLREPILPVAYVPFAATDDAGAPQLLREATFVVRTAASDPLALAGTVRRGVPRAWPAFRVSNIHTQSGLIHAQTLRERLLAMLALFFAAVAALLAGIGLYGVLDYSVLRRRREIGIRMAIGAQSGGIARLVTGEALASVLSGAATGLGLGMLSSRYVVSLLYQVKATDAVMFLIPGAAILAISLVAAIVPVLRAVRIDPADSLRAG